MNKMVMPCCELSGSKGLAVDGPDAGEGIYQVLRDDGDHQKIRILTLLPSSDKKTQIKCSLEIVSLKDHASYTALSYTWGDWVDRREIFIDGHPLLITANLHEALKRFRKSQDSIKLWVDAICINQKDLPERDSQVRLMREIFCQAEQTWLWLGIEADASEKALNLIERLSTIYLRSCPPWDTRPESADKKLWGSLESHSNEDELIALSGLLARDYWYRVWVVQEIAVSSEIVISCGERKLSWDSVLFAAYLLDQQLEYRDLVHGHRVGQKRTRGIQSGIQRIMSIQSVRNDFQGTNFAGEKKDSLLFLLTNHRSTEATELKDKYIALAGLIIEVDPSTSLPFYDESVGLQDVYMLAAYQLAYQSFSSQQIRPLDFLDCAGGHSNISDLPSWVPDWSITTGRATPLLYWQLAAETDEYLVPMNVVRQLPQSHKSTFSFQQVQGKGRLQAEGLRFDSVAGLSFSNESVIKAPKQEPWPYPMGEKAWSILWKTCVLDRAHAGAHKAPSSWENIFYQYASNPSGDSPLSILHQWYNQNKYFEICGQTLETIVQERQSSTTQMDHTDVTLAHFKTAFTNAVGHRKLAVTEKGYLCLIPQAAESGDIIAILLDCNVPVVLRPFEAEFIFVGTSYVHGIMNGKGVAGPNLGSFSIR